MQLPNVICSIHLLPPYLRHSKSSSTIFSIAGFIIALVLDLAALILILRIFYQTFKTSREVSPLLLMNLIAWVTVCIAALPYYLYMIATWRMENTTNNGYWIFWIGAPSQCLFAAVPTSVFVLTLDRIYCVYWPMMYQKQTKSVINITCVILIVTSVVANVLADLNELPIPEKTTCQAFGCLQTRQKTVFIAGRLGFSFVNILAQSIFLHKLMIIRKSFNGAISRENYSSANNTMNQIVIILILADFFVNFLPQIFALVANQFPLRKLLDEIGPYNNVLAGIDALITSLTYTKVLRNTKTGQTVVPKEALSRAVNASKTNL